MKPFCQYVHEYVLLYNTVYCDLDLQFCSAVQCIVTLTFRICYFMYATFPLKLSSKDATEYYSNVVNSRLDFRFNVDSIKSTLSMTHKSL